MCACVQARGGALGLGFAPTCSFDETDNKVEKWIIKKVLMKSRMGTKIENTRKEQNRKTQFNTHAHVNGLFLSHTYRSGSSPLYTNK